MLSQPKETTAKAQVDASHLSLCGHKNAWHPFACLQECVGMFRLTHGQVKLIAHDEARAVIRYQEGQQRQHN